MATKRSKKDAAEVAVLVVTDLARQILDELPGGRGATSPLTRATLNCLSLS